MCSEERPELLGVTRPIMCSGGGVALATVTTTNKEVKGALLSCSGLKTHKCACVPDNISMGPEESREQRAALLLCDPQSGLYKSLLRPGLLSQSGEPGELAFLPHWNCQHENNSRGRMMAGCEAI